MTWAKAGADRGVENEEMCKYTEIVHYLRRGIGFVEIWSENDVNGNNFRYTLYDM